MPSDREALTRGSQRDALQRYVIAWWERERAIEQVVAALQHMQIDALEALRYLREHGSSPVDVDLLDGTTWQVFADSAGIVVVPRAAD